jgi:hypothetical protein
MELALTQTMSVEVHSTTKTQEMQKETLISKWFEL